VVDIVRGDLLIEVQTGNFAALKHKLTSLNRRHKVRLVHPIARQKWVVKTADDGRRLSRRRSPKHGSVQHAFEELVYIAGLLRNPGLSLELVFTEEEEMRRKDPRGGWRKKGWVTCERRLVRVFDRHLIEGPDGLLALLPASLPDPFSTADLAPACAIPRRLAQKMVYCLRITGGIVIAGKSGNSVLYARSNRDHA
jgi:hypothetical protein